MNHAGVYKGRVGLACGKHHDISGSHRSVHVSTPRAFFLFLAVFKGMGSNEDIQGGSRMNFSVSYLFLFASVERAFRTVTLLSGTLTCRREGGKAK